MKRLETHTIHDILQAHTKYALRQYAPKAHDLLAQMTMTLLASGGKRLRFALAWHCAHLFQIETNAGERWATICELLHNATLVHDDIQDGDTCRRNAPSMWARFGTAQAINLGDALLYLPLLLLEDMPYIAIEHRYAALQTANQTMLQVIAGQISDCARGDQPVGNLAAYEAMVAAKTGSMLALPVHGAALLAGYSADAAASYAEPFVTLGVALQIQDDLIDLYGNKQRQGSVGNDLLEGKCSALTVHFCQRVPAQAARLQQLLALPRAQTPQSEIQWAIEAFVRSGVAAEVQGLLQQRLAQSQQATAELLQPAWQQLWQNLGQKLKFSVD